VNFYRKEKAMTTQPMSANRQAFIDSSKLILANPELTDQQLARALHGLVDGLLGAEKPARAVDAAPSAAVKNGYVPGILHTISNFMYAEQKAGRIDDDIGLSLAEIHDRMVSQELLNHSINAYNIHRVLNGNHRHFTRLANGNWKPRSTASLPLWIRRRRHSRDAELR
jgi:hypothetical protein